MGKSLTWRCKLKPREVPNIWQFSETGRARIQNNTDDVTTGIYLTEIAQCAF